MNKLNRKKQENAYETYNKKNSFIKRITSVLIVIMMISQIQKVSVYAANTYRNKINISNSSYDKIDWLDDSDYVRKSDQYAYFSNKGKMSNAGKNMCQEMLEKRWESFI